MIFERIERLLTQTESTNLEFKTAGNAVPKNLFETICAFLNREGGDILLAVDDEQKTNKIANLLTNLRRSERIINTASRKKLSWKLAE